MTVSESLMTSVGLIAAALTALSYVPQAIKAAPRHSTDDLSVGMLVSLMCGLLLWVTYGTLKNDYVIVAANGIGSTLVGFVLCCKLRDLIFTQQSER